MKPVHLSGDIITVHDSWNSLFQHHQVSCFAHFGASLKKCGKTRLTKRLFTLVKNFVTIYQNLRPLNYFG